MNSARSVKNSWVVGVFLFLFSQSALSSACSDAFPNVVQSHVVNNPVSFSCGSQVINSPTNILTASLVNNPSSCATKTCGAVDCSVSGTIAPTLAAGAFQVSSKAGGNEAIALNGFKTLDGNENSVSDYDSVTINFSGQLSFSRNTLFHKTVYRIQQLTMADTSILHLKSGDYWIENLIVEGHSTITTDASEGSVRLFIKNFTNTGGGQLIWNQGGSASDLLIYSYSDIELGGIDSEIKALLYSQGDVTLKNNIQLTGAINAVAINLNDTASVQYDANAATNAYYGFLCPNPAVAYFEVSTPQVAVNCQTLSVTVTARDEIDQVVSDYTGTIMLDTLANHKGTWLSTTGGGTFVGDNVHGTATYEFVESDNGVASFQFTYPPTGTNPILIKVYDINDPIVLGYSGEVNFIPPGFVITDYMIPPGTTVLASDFSSPQVSGVEFTLYLTAFKKNKCQVNTNFKGNKQIQLWTDYINPTTGTVTLLINGQPIAIGESTTPETTQLLNFTDGVATVQARYDDAGKLMLGAKHKIASGPRGSTGYFVVRPSEFVINVPGNAAAQVSSPSSAAVAACLADTVFKRAGEVFSVSVQARNALGGVTPNYGNEIIPEGVLLSSGTLLAPNPGQNGSSGTGLIGNGSAFSKITTDSGPFAEAPYFSGSNFSFDEVGCIQLDASVASGSYLGAGNVMGSQVVGRFIPDHFEVIGNTPQFKTACERPTVSFTYLDEPFYYETPPNISVSARSVGNTITQNYTGDFWRLTDAHLGALYNKAYYPIAAGDSIPDLTIASSAPVFTDQGNGTGEFAFTEEGGVIIQRMDSALVPPFTAELQLQIPTIQDADGVQCTVGCQSGGFDFGQTSAGNGITFSGVGGGKTFYHGRLAIMEVSGSELLEGYLPMRVEYFTTAHGFVLNDQDSCANFQGGPASLQLEPTSGLNTTATLPSPSVFQDGVMNIMFSAPNVSGYVDVETDLSITGARLPWLQYNWPYEGTSVVDFSLNPRGRYTFGIFKGNEPVIYKKEETD